MVVLPQLGGELSSLQLDLRVWRQVFPRGSLTNHSVGLNVQVPVHSETQSPVQTRHVYRAALLSGYLNSLSLSIHTHTEGRYGAGAAALVWPCLSSEVLAQGLAPGVLGEIGIVGVVGVTGIST